MGSVNQALWYIFALSIVLVVVVYYVGVTTDVTTFTSAFVSLVQAATGRNAQGQFASYPAGSASATTAATTAAATTGSVTPFGAGQTS